MLALKQTLKDSLGLGLIAPRSSDEHLRATMAWLCRAQDAAGGGGVARMFHLRTGWGAAYPETTGYIIPTFYDFACWSGDQAYAERANRMAEWESMIQMPDGAVQGGTIADKPTPAIFNTGQVLFGWRAAYLQTGSNTYRESLTRAADYLVSVQDHDGAWRRNLSAFCDAPVDSYAYNVRSAWALWLAGDSLNDNRYQQAARNNLEYVLSLSRPNGWVEKNCLNDPIRPLLHTIAYTHQGMLELGIRAGNDDAVSTVVNGSIALRDCYRRHGTLHGRYDATWQPASTWRCLTGEAQTAIVWYRLGQVTGDKSWHHSAKMLVGGLKRTQVLAGEPGITGGVKGSFPIHGWYGKYEYLNWAAKFLADALLLDLGNPEASIRG